MATPKFGLQEMEIGQQNGEERFNKALRYLVTLSNLSVIDDVTQPPLLEYDWYPGLVYLVFKDGGAGVFVGMQNQIAFFYATENSNGQRKGWEFQEPFIGMLLWHEADQKHQYWDEFNWVDL